MIFDVRYHPTIDIPLAELPLTRDFLNRDALPRRIYPMLGKAFANSLPSWKALRVADPFIVKCDAAGGQTMLAPHRDGFMLSFNVALNERNEYEGGGTWFAGMGLLKTRRRSSCGARPARCAR